MDRFKLGEVEGDAERPQSTLTRSPTGDFCYYQEAQDEIEESRKLAGLSFANFRRINVKRSQSVAFFGGAKSWTTAEWMMALVGEVGELANILKRVQRGDFNFAGARANCARELADIMAYLDLLAHKLEIDLGQATKQKFNEVSDRVGSDLKIP